jgi:predicted ATPase
MARDQRGPVFFDRGVPDCIGYLRLMGLPVPAHMRRAADVCRYNRLVFLAPPWRQIFRRDEERKQDFVEAVRTCEALASTYSDLGYELIELPKASVEERLHFLLEKVGEARSPAS